MCPQFGSLNLNYNIYMHACIIQYNAMYRRNTRYDMVQTYWLHINRSVYCEALGSTHRRRRKPWRDWSYCWLYGRFLIKIVGVSNHWVQCHPEDKTRSLHIPDQIQAKGVYCLVLSPAQEEPIYPGLSGSSGSAYKRNYWLKLTQPNEPNCLGQISEYSDICIKYVYHVF